MGRRVGGRAGQAVGGARGAARRPSAAGAIVMAVGASAIVVSAVVVLTAGVTRSVAQDAGTPPETAAPEAVPKKVEHKRRPKPPVVRKRAEAPPPAAQAPATIAPAVQPAAAPAPNLFDAQLLKAGATTCAPIVSQLAAASMGGVTTVGTASNWNNQTPDKRPVTLLLGQKYGPGGVPNGATTVIAAPQPDGKCDAYSVQVVPSPLPCAKLRETMAKGSRQLADLAGVALMQDAASETMLVPTAANTCVLVGLRGVYAK